MSVDERAVRALERLADANEAIVKLASDEREDAEGIPRFAPAICPHCLKTDPEVAIEAAEGRFEEMIVIAHCRNCGQRFFGVPQGWLCYRDPEAALAEIDERRES